MDLTVIKTITERQLERTPSPVYKNYQIARKMHQNNLNHQPLPDRVSDKAFRKFQIQGSGHPGLGLSINPIASGVGVKAYNTDPNHCTKMKIFRPKSFGVVPKIFNEVKFSHQPLSQHQVKKMGSMDLAIGWDYSLDKPKLPWHKDGSNEPTGAAVFTFVKPPQTPNNIKIADSSSIFTNTYGEQGFFHKNILRRKTVLAEADPSKYLICTRIPNLNAENSIVKSVSLGNSSIYNDFEHNQYQSTQNVLTFKISDYQKEKQQLSQNNSFQLNVKKKNNKSHSGSLKKLCYKDGIQAYNEKKDKEVKRLDLCAGINATPISISSDSGNRSIFTESCSISNKIPVVKRPQHPHNTRNYDIETLVPPFTSLKNGAGQSGYPEHWRLISVYQQAYKPIKQRKRPLIETIFK